MPGCSKRSLTQQPDVAFCDARHARDAGRLDRAILNAHSTLAVVEM